MRELIEKWQKNWRSHLLHGVVLSFVVVPLAITMIYMSLHEGDRSKPYVPALQKIAQETPVYPNAKKTAENVVLKDSMAYLHTSYRASAPFAATKAFYERELPARGWALPKGCNLFIESDAHCKDYRRGDYFIAIESEDGSDDFSIVFIWDPQ
jgi:hypothetical protein